MEDLPGNRPFATRVRVAGEADLPSLLTLYAQLHPDDEPLSVPAAHEVWRQVVDQPGRTVLVAEVDGGVVGTVDCAVLPNLTRGGRAFMLIENVVVAAAARRRGVGTAMLAEAVRLARAAGCYKIQLLSRTSREAAHSLYESQGFRIVAQGYRRYLD